MPIGHPMTPALFWRQCRRDDADCWPYPGTLSAGGQAFVSVKHKTMYAHRFAFELTYRPLLPREPVVQTCGNLTCCNPRHLVASSQKAIIAARGPRIVPVDVRFDAKVRREDGGCWRWIGARTKAGYGNFSLTGRRGHEVFVPAHRYAYERVKGPIPPGLVLDHLCSHRWCVNPDHLEPVTQRENVRRAVALMHRSGTCARGHPVGQDGHFMCRECMRLRDRARYVKRRRKAGRAVSR